MFEGGTTVLVAVTLDSGGVEHKESLLSISPEDVASEKTVLECPVSRFTVPEALSTGFLNTGVNTFGVYQI